MSIPIASANRLQIRQTIGDNIGVVIASSASATGSPTTLSDQYALIKGGQDEYLGWQAEVVSSGTVAADYAKRFVTASSAGVLTLSAALAATTVAGNAYELWKPPYTIEQINNLIAQAERDVTPLVFVDKTDETVFTEVGKYRYAIPSGFVALHNIEYVEGEGEYETIEECDAVWSEKVDTNVTASADDDLRGGETWLKLDVAAAAAASTLLATEAITVLDLRDCTEVEFSVYSTVALAASAMQLLLDNTAQCASPVESLNWPATSASTFTRHIVSLANPPNDGTVISVGVKMMSDATATFYIRNIRAVRADSRRYATLLPEYWNLVRGSTNYVDLTSEAKSITGNDCLLRFDGYSAITAMASETSISQVDPQYLVDSVSSDLILSRNPTPMDKNRGDRLAQRAAAKKQQMATPMRQGTRWL